MASTLLTLAVFACGHAEPEANAGHAKRAVSVTPRPEQVVQSINPAPAAAAGKPVEQPSAASSSAVQGGAQASTQEGSAATTSVALDHPNSDGAAPGNQITMKHVEAELNRLEAELGK
ncbi:MAG TPA: hypothetical protein VG963_18835 [Polyangiaceae bacterium]|nr:hypothetical protein [Polyangiaceae bacterium]